MVMEYLVIDIGGTKIKFGIFSKQGIKSFSAKLDTPDNKAEFTQIIERLIRKYRNQIKGVAISVPGKVNVKKGIVYYGGSLPYLDKYNFKGVIQAIVPTLKVRLQNDGKAGILGEKWRGCLQNDNNAAAIVLGTAVGGGIILNGQILEGSHFQAGEFSFLPNNIKAQGKECFTGTSGSAVKMIETCTGILGLANRQDGRKVFEELKAHNSKIWPLFSEYCRGIAYLILGLQAILDLDSYVIAGGISANSILITEIRRAYEQVASGTPFVKPVIKQARLQNDANLYGALYTLLQTVK